LPPPFLKWEHTSTTHLSWCQVSTFFTCLPLFSSENTHPLLTFPDVRWVHSLPASLFSQVRTHIYYPPPLAVRWVHIYCTTRLPCCQLRTCLLPTSIFSLMSTHTTHLPCFKVSTQLPRLSAFSRVNTNLLTVPALKCVLVQIYCITHPPRHSAEYTSTFPVS
jgi:hypothetical protein